MRRQDRIHYFNGNGVPQDYAKAQEWYEKAAMGGEAVAMLNLGGLYENGQAFRKTMPRRGMV